MANTTQKSETQVDLSTMSRAQLTMLRKQIRDRVKAARLAEKAKANEYRSIVGDLVDTFAAELEEALKDLGIRRFRLSFDNQGNRRWTVRTEAGSRIRPLGQKEDGDVESEEEAA